MTDPDDDYLSPEQTDVILQRMGDLSNSVPLSEIIKKFVKDDPKRQRLLDEARERLREQIVAGEEIFTVHDLVLTERGFKSMPIDEDTTNKSD